MPYLVKYRNICLIFAILFSMDSALLAKTGGSSGGGHGNGNNPSANPGQGPGDPSPGAKKPLEGGTDANGRPANFKFKGTIVNITFDPNDLGEKTWHKDDDDGKPNLGPDGKPVHWGSFDYNQVTYEVSGKAPYFDITIYSTQSPGQPPVVFEPPQQFHLNNGPSR